MKKILLSALMLVTLCGFAQAQKTPKVATFELQKVLTDYKKADLMNKNLQADTKKVTDQRTGALEKLQALRNEIEKMQTDAQSPLLSEKAKADAETALKAKIQEYQQFYQSATAQERSAAETLQARGQANARALILEVRPVIEDIAKEKGIDLVLDGSFTASGVWFTDKSLDITDEVLKRLNDAYAKQEAEDSAITATPAKEEK